jgi:hypothetical protein
MNFTPPNRSEYRGYNEISQEESWSAQGGTRSLLVKTIASRRVVRDFSRRKQ